MTDRIKVLKQAQWDKVHHSARKAVPDGIAVLYRNASQPDYMRTALRLKAALDNETPYLFRNELIAFTRTLPNLPFIYTDEEWTEIKSTHYIHELGNVSNLSPDYERVLRSGLNAIRAELTDSPYHEAMRISIDAVLALTRRYEAAARAEGLYALADTLKKVPAEGATTFREALQSLRILHYAMWCEGDYHNTLGLFDQYMLPYFNAADEDNEFELLEAFFLSCNRDSDLYPGMQQGDNGQSIVLGANGNYTRLSELCLKASGELRLIDPKLNLRVNKDTPLSAYETGTQLTKLGLGFPQYENDEVAIPGLIALGYAPEDARQYAMAACWEFIIPGKGMEIPNIGALPFASSVDGVIRAHLIDVKDMDELKALVKSDIEKRVKETLAERVNLYVIPSPFLSLFFDGCLEQQKDISLGCVYNSWGLHGTGLASACDMLAAVETEVFSGKISANELLAAMNANFAGYDALRNTLQTQCPKMGNDDDCADKYASFLLDTFSNAVKGYKNERGGIIRAGTGSAMYYITHAEELGATADGRVKGTPLGANYSPSIGVKLNGPVSIIKSFSKPELSKTINGGPLTIEFSESVFSQNESITKVAQLVKLFMARGGHQLQLNTVNRDTLLDAQAHPEKYRNLIVRVWGWSGYFVELDKCYQDHIIRRAELSF